MIRIVSALVVFVLLAMGATSAEPAITDDKVILRIHTTVESQSQSSMVSTTIISTLDANDQRESKVDQYRLLLSVTDVRNGEYSVLVVLRNDSDQPLDSATVLVESGKQAMFRFSVGEDSIFGSISVSRAVVSTDQ